MTAYQAKQITKKGLRFALAGLILGFILSFNHGAGMILICGYTFWCLFHGVQMMQPIVRYMYDFGPVHLETRSIPALFFQSTLLKFLKVMIPLVAGYFIGVLGGAILRQIYLFIVASSN